MGTVIAKTAAADDIVRDAQTTHEQGVARGGRIQQIVDDRLASLLLLIASIATELSTLRAQIVTLRATRDAAVQRATDLVSECADVLWNRIGRPANDARFDLLFPGGASAYTSGPMDGLGDRIAVLIGLLGRGLHPQITAELATEWQTKLGPAQHDVASAIAALVAPVTHETVLERSYYSVIKRVQSALATVKRDLKSEGLTEAQIHEVIPDRPRESAKPASPTRENGTAPHDATPIAPMAPAAGPVSS